MYNPLSVTVYDPPTCNVYTDLADWQTSEEEANEQARKDLIDFRVVANIGDSEDETPQPVRLTGTYINYPDLQGRRSSVTVNKCEYSSGRDWVETPCDVAEAFGLDLNFEAECVLFSKTIKRMKI